MAVYAEMPNGVRLEFPDGTTPEAMQGAAQEYLKGQGMSGAPVAPGISNQPAHESMGWGDVMVNAGKNFVPSAVRAGEDLVSMVTHPGDTVDALGGLAKGVGQKVWRNISGGTQEGDSEKYVNAVGQYFKDRYGSMDGFKQAVAFDPVGVLSDVSSAFTGGAGALKGTASLLRAGAKAGKLGGAAADLASGMQKAGNVASKVGSYTDPLSATIKGGDWAVHHAFGNGYTPAMRLYQAALKPTTGLSNNAKARFGQDELLGMLREGVDKGIPITTHGENKANRVIGGINDKIDAAIDNADAAGLRVSPEDIASGALSSDARAEIAAGNVPTADLRAFDDAVMDYLEAHGGDDTLRAAQEGKKATYRQFQKAYQNNASKQASGKTEAAKELAAQQRLAIGDAIDKGIAEGTIPDTLNARSIHDLNAEEGRVIGLRDAIGRAVQRGGNRSAFSVLPAMLYGAGTGDWGNAFLTGAALPFLTSPGFQSYAAIGMDRAGKALKKAEPVAHGLASFGYGEGRNERVNAENVRQGNKGKAKPTNLISKFFE